MTEVQSLLDAIRALVEDIDQIHNMIDQEVKAEPRTVDDWLLNMAFDTAQSTKAGIMLSRIAVMGWSMESKAWVRNSAMEARRLS